MFEQYGLNSGESNLVEWQYRYAGGFMTSLFECISHADDNNLELLRTGFPLEIEAYLRFTSEPGYWDSLLTKIKTQSLKSAASFSAS